MVSGKNSKKGKQSIQSYVESFPETRVGADKSANRWQLGTAAGTFPGQLDLHGLSSCNDLHDSHLRFVIEVLPRFDNDVQVGVTKFVKDSPGVFPKRPPNPPFLPDDGLVELKIQSKQRRN